MKLRSNYRVQVSRMTDTPFRVTCVVLDETLVTSVPDGDPHSGFLLSRNSRRTGISVHSVLYGANFSLLHPRHRYYALLSPALYRLVRESRANSYRDRQDGLW